MGRSAPLLVDVSAFARVRCLCGVLLAQPITGRPRATCSVACRRRLDALRRRIRTKERWIAGWRDLEQNGLASPAQVRRAIRLLEQDIRELVRGSTAPQGEIPTGSPVDRIGDRDDVSP